jgi:Ser/Thr protein kinase RdoA (MazF antagonist)
MTGMVFSVDAPGHEFRRLVLKLYRPDPTEADCAGREARILELLAPAGLPVPHVVAMDREGTDSEWPALLMTRMPGRRRFRPREVGPWLDGLARLMARIHALQLPSESLPAYELWGAQDPLPMPSWWSRPEVWARAVEVFRGPAPEERPIFIHRDFHPGNVLWKGRRPSAIVDWLHGCRGPAAVDVAHCRLNLWRDNGPEVANAWTALVGGSLHPYWDVADALSWIPDPALDGARVARRFESFIVDAVSRLG